MAKVRITRFSCQYLDRRTGLLTTCCGSFYRLVGVLLGCRVIFHRCFSRWWLNNPFEKYSSNWESSPNRGENKINIFETTTPFLAGSITKFGCYKFPSPLVHMNIKLYQNKQNKNTQAALHWENPPNLNTNFKKPNDDFLTFKLSNLSYSCTGKNGTAPRAASGWQCQRNPAIETAKKDVEKSTCDGIMTHQNISQQYIFIE